VLFFSTFLTDRDAGGTDSTRCGPAFLFFQKILSPKTMLRPSRDTRMDPDDAISTTAIMKDHERLHEYEWKVSWSYIIPEIVPVANTSKVAPSSLEIL
jgi:hypothetical protein